MTAGFDTHVPILYDTLRANECIVGIHMSIFNFHSTNMGYTYIICADEE